MKTMLTVVIAFLAGVVIAGLVGFKVMLSFSQMAILGEMTTHSLVLDMIAEQKVSQLQKLNCAALTMAMANYGELTSSIWVFDNAPDTAAMNEKLLAKVQGQVSNPALCRTAEQGAL